MTRLDENDRLRAGRLPSDPEDDARPLEDETWEQPILFGDTDVPEFPVGVLPGWLGLWATEQARALQTPVDLPALLGLAVLSSTTAKKIAVEVKPGWREPTNLYVAVALAPGEGKSPIFSAALAPLREWERGPRLVASPIAPSVERLAGRSLFRPSLRLRSSQGRQYAARDRPSRELLW